MSFDPCSVNAEAKALVPIERPCPTVSTTGQGSGKDIVDRGRAPHHRHSKMLPTFNVYLDYAENFSVNPELCKHRDHSEGAISSLQKTLSDPVLMFCC